MIVILPEIDRRILVIRIRRELQQLVHGLPRQQGAMLQALRGVGVRLLHQRQTMPVRGHHRHVAFPQQKQRAVQRKTRLLRGNREDRLLDHPDANRPIEICPKGSAMSGRSG
jgi:hypothetical protein